MTHEYTYNNGTQTAPCAVVKTNDDGTADLLGVEDEGDAVKLIRNVPLGEGGKTYQKAS